MTRRRHWPLVIVASTALMGFVLMVDAPVAIRGPVAAWFLLVCPGMTLAAPLALRSGGAELALAVILSVTIATVVATALLLAGALSAASAYLALSALCLAGCAARRQGVSGR